MSATRSDNPSSVEDRARRLNEMGLAHMDHGSIRPAIAAFDASIALFATVEGYTNRGRAHSHLNNWPKAIADCRRAIRLDRRHGRPYNDIGVYLIAQGHLQEAVPWLERAKQALFFPRRLEAFLNLGRLYMMLDEQNRALTEFVGVLELDPANHESKSAIASMEMHF